MGNTQVIKKLAKIHGDIKVKGAINYEEKKKFVYQ